MNIKNLAIMLLFLVSSVSAWSNDYTHPWFCEQSVRAIFGNETFEQNSNVTECSTYPDLKFHDTAKHHCYKTCPVNSTYYCGDPEDCPAYEKTLEYFAKARNESNINQKLCDFCIATHYFSDMQVPFHQIRYENQSCHSSYESKAETRISQPEKYGNWSFTQTCNNPPANFRLSYQDMLGIVDKIVEEWNVVPNTTVEIPLYHSWNLISLPVVPNTDREFLSPSQELASYGIPTIILAILLCIIFLLWLWLESKRHPELPQKNCKIPEFRDYFR